MLDVAIDCGFKFIKSLIWDKVGKNYTILLDEIITMAIKNYKKQNKKITSFESNILSTFNGSKGLKGMKGKMGR